MSRFGSLSLAAILALSGCGKSDSSQPERPSYSVPAPVQPARTEHVVQPRGVSLSFQYDGLNRLKAVTVDLGAVAAEELRKYAPIYCAVTGTNQESRFPVESGVSFRYELISSVDPFGRDFLIYSKDDSRIRVFHRKSLSDLLPSDRRRNGR